MTLNTTLSVDATLEIGGVEETVIIAVAAPVVDVTTTTTAVNFTEDLLEDVPNARDIWVAMAQAPGFQMEAYDVGGSHTGTQTGFQAFGFGDQHRTLFEGINVTEWDGVERGLLRLRQPRGLPTRRRREHGRDARPRRLPQPDGEVWRRPFSPATSTSAS